MKHASTTKARLTPEGAVMIEHPDGGYRPAPNLTNWERVSALSNAEVDAAAQADPDAPPLDDAFWQAAQVILPPRTRKRHQGMRLDAEVTKP
jgi:hypothetical protein